MPASGGAAVTTTAVFVQADEPGHQPTAPAGDGGRPGRAASAVRVAGGGAAAVPR